MTSEAAPGTPPVPTVLTVLDRDHEFDRGSAIYLDALTPLQTENLVLLGKVWGFLKYDHPAITAGQKHWDYELFRILPAVLAARDPAAANTVVANWAESLGPIQSCHPCVDTDQLNTAAEDIALRPDLRWITNEALLGKPLSRSLVTIEYNRIANQQFYVSLQPGVQNPSFDHELAYPQITTPDPGFQLLALYRFWNIIEYWSPYRDLVGEDWDGVLRAFLPRIALAKSVDDYQRELMALIARAHDTHANLWSSLRLRPPTGSCRLPVNVRFIPGWSGPSEPVVASFASPDGATTGLKPGDVLEALDHVPVSTLVAGWSPYYAGSNEAARLRDMAFKLTDGECGPAEWTVRRDSEHLQLTAKRLPAMGMPGIRDTHDLPGETFRLLSPEVAYLKLSSVKVADVNVYLERAAKTKGLIIDIRNYPSAFVVFALGSHFVTGKTAFARFTDGDLSTPGAFHWTAPEMLTPAAPFYPGKVVILVDEDSQSQAEYTAMAFRAAPHAVVIGSTTAGADGNVSEFALPGGQHTMISGIGVFYPDGKPTQRIGIVPDRTVWPTVKGLSAGRDEVLEEGIRMVVGADISLGKIEKMIAVN